MIYLRARFYAPEMNRFSQKDILRGEVTDALSLNRYLYCENDPINFIDPSGMKGNGIKGFVNNVKSFIKTTAETVVNYVGNTLSNMNAGKQQIADAILGNNSSASGQKTSGSSSGNNGGGSNNNSSSGSSKGGTGNNSASSSDSKEIKKTPTPSNYSYAQSPTIQEVIKATDCGRRGNVIGVGVNKLSSNNVENALGTRSNVLMWAISAEEVLGFSQIKYLSDINLEKVINAQHLTNEAKATSNLYNKAIPVVGAAVDLATLLISGETLESSIIKSGAHFAIGLGVSTIVTATALTGGASLAVAVLGTIAVSTLFDYLYDNSKVKQNIDATHILS